MSLIELLVVLALAGMAMSLSLPGLFSARDAYAFHAQADTILASVPNRGVAARREQRVVRVTGGEARLPPGWRLEGGPITFLPSGACLGGALTVTGPNGRQRTALFEPPRCAFVPQGRPRGDAGA